MKEKSLFKLALICSLIGILIILFIAEKIDIEESTIDKINKELLDEKVKVKGVVLSKYDKQGLFLLNIREDDKEIAVLVFGESLNIKKGDIIEVEGILTEYKGKLEIIASTIKVF